MIDTWLFAALVLCILALGVILRGVSAKSRDDRLVAGTVTVIMVSMTALLLSIGSGIILILDIVIIFALCSFCIMYWSAKTTGADQV